jgi:hypothetical protein
MDNNHHVNRHRIVRLFWILPWIVLSVLAPLLMVGNLGKGLPVIHRFNLAILVLPWLTGTVLLATWSAGPVKNWAVPWLISFSFPLIVLEYGVHLTRASSFASGSSFAVFGFFVAVSVACYLQFITRMRPARCPGCGRAALIPLMKVREQDQRSANTRWCAACGGEYWRGRQGVWNEEKRTTWHKSELRRRESATTAGHRSPNPAPTSKTQAAPESSIANA